MTLLQPFNEILNSCNEIVANDYQNIFYETNTSLDRMDSPFGSQESYQCFIQNLIHEFDLDINLNKPFAESIIYGKYRLTLVHPVLSQGDYAMTLRSLEPQRVKEEWFSSYYEHFGFKEFVQNFIDGKTSLVVGGTGSGKTTLVSHLLSKVSGRIVTVEDTREIFIEHPNHLPLVSRKSVHEIYKNIELADLLKLSLRLRPDRLIVGEIRAQEAVPFIHAINTGHSGSIATIHGSSVRSALQRLALLLCTYQQGCSMEVARQIIAQSIEQVCYLEKTISGRRVQQVSRIQGFDAGEILLEEMG